MVWYGMVWYGMVPYHSKGGLSCESRTTEQLCTEGCIACHYQTHTAYLCTTPTIVAVYDTHATLVLTFRAVYAVLSRPSSPMHFFTIPQSIVLFFKL
jgi:hypothetical protein